MKTWLPTVKYLLTRYITARSSLALLRDTRLGKMAIGGSPAKLDFIPRDVGMVVVDVALAMAAKDMLIKQGLIPADILK